MSPPFGPETSTDDVVAHLRNEIKGKIILTTGVSPASIGANFVRSIVKAEPRMLILANRDQAKSQETQRAIIAEETQRPNLVDVRLLELDLGSLDSVRRSARTLMSWGDVPHVDVLVNNAGIMATDYGVSEEGFERQFAVNHLGHFLFTNCIMEKLLASKAPRVINVSSDGHRLNPIRWGDYGFSGGETYNRWAAYGQSKTANILMAISMAEKLGSKGLLALSLNPGTPKGTNLGNHVDWALEYPSLQALDKSLGNAEGWHSDFKWKTAEQGAATHVYAAFERSLEDKNGAYLQDCRVADPWTDTVKPWATSRIEAERLWKLSEELVKQEFKLQ